VFPTNLDASALNPHKPQDAKRDVFDTKVLAESVDKCRKLV
jgi:hypothetical protein